MTFDDLPAAWREGVADDDQDRELRVRTYQTSETARHITEKEVLAMYREGNDDVRRAASFLLRRLRGHDAIVS